MMRPIWLPAVLLAVAAAGCQQREAPQISDRYPALGTLVEVTLRGVPEEEARAALRGVRAEFDHAQHEWHAWGDGELARFNEAIAAAGTTRVPPALAGELERAAELERLSGGLFNPMVGWLVEAWGFHDGERPDAPPPDESLIEGWLADRPSLTGFMAHPAGGDKRRIDLGAFAKGLAMERALRRLRAHGITHALVNAGGDLGVLGDGGGRPWRIGIRDPRGPGVFAGIELDDGEVIFTSGDYERWFEYDGERWHHILDPRTGRPARGTMSMTVVHTDPGLADAAATALFVAGDDWPVTARSMGITQAMRIDANGDVEILAPLAARVRFEREPENIRRIDVEAR